MTDALQDADEYREKLQSVLEGLAVAGGIYWQIRTSTLSLIDAVVVIAVPVVIIGLAGWLIEAYDLRSAVKSLAFGAVATTYGAALFVFGGVPQAVAVGLFVVGAWFLFHAVQVVRHDGLYADGSGPPDRPGVPRDDVARQVDYALRDRPRTRRELCDELDLDAAAVDDALATLDERRVLTREGSELRTCRTPGEAPGSIARIQRAVKRGASRLARPVTVELQG
ncbi:hypothetical protein SAMN05216559_0722 [Halomicrobium zhouii]|uniref:Uncharacterized protein n=1 Tax=Halomicrobium zhouii TaxID=767519 RepID=A0A1I6KFQ2_9EURY|nr:hypothetical protein [Halomicrobium zhouii]SFR89984.1 hypothetical protein SAMN05216559_0722 [Halomicrobium zhouii]